MFISKVKYTPKNKWYQFEMGEVYIKYGVLKRNYDHRSFVRKINKMCSLIHFHKTMLDFVYY